MNPAQASHALDSLAAIPGTLDAAGFIQRNRALEQLEFLRDELCRQQHTEVLLVRLDSLRARLQRRNDLLVQQFRHRLRQDRAAKALELREYVTGDPSDEGYDDLDVLVGAIFDTGQPLADGTATWDTEMVPYQPTPARVVLQLVEELRPTPQDAFVDIGSGLGTVPMLVSLLTGAASLGIEVEPAHHAHAVEAARQLGLREAHFLCQDARVADLSSGTIFYLFTPFRGAMLEAVLRRLSEEARRRPIRVCTHGPFLVEAMERSAPAALRRTDAGSGPVAVFQSLAKARHGVG